MCSSDLGDRHRRRVLPGSPQGLRRRLRLCQPPRHRLRMRPAPDGVSSGRTERFGPFFLASHTTANSIVRDHENPPETRPRMNQATTTYASARPTIRAMHSIWSGPSLLLGSIRALTRRARLVRDRTPVHRALIYLLTMDERQTRHPSDRVEAVRASTTGALK